MFVFLALFSWHPTLMTVAVSRASFFVNHALFTISVQKNKNDLLSKSKLKSVKAVTPYFMMQKIVICTRQEFGQIFIVFSVKCHKRLSYCLYVFFCFSYGCFGYQCLTSKRLINATCQQQ